MVMNMWARIDNGRVAETTELDPTGRYHPSLVWLPCTAEVSVGWMLDNDQLVPPAVPVPTTGELCDQVDATADAARRAVAGDPLRAVEYDRARLAAEAFAAADYQGEVPAMVAAWAINGRTPQQAADDILAEAAAYTNALELLRTTRLAAKEQIRTLMADNQVEQAQQLTEQTIAAIEAAVAGIGNNA